MMADLQDWRQRRRPEKLQQFALDTNAIRMTPLSCVAWALGRNRLRLHGKCPVTALAKERLSRRVSQGTVMQPTSSMPSPVFEKAAVSDRTGNCCVCFSRLNRSSSRTNSGLPSERSAMPASWLRQAIPRMFKSVPLVLGIIRLRERA